MTPGAKSFSAERAFSFCSSLLLGFSRIATLAKNAAIVPCRQAICIRGEWVRLA